MKKFNLIHEIVSVPQIDFIEAVKSKKTFAICYDGTISYELDTQKPVIYKGRPQTLHAINGTSVPITEILGKEYTITLNGPKLDIKASMAWQSIIAFNMDSASYDDTTGDGISHFTDDTLEDMGWYATDFDISYREMVEHLEEKLDEGIVFCIERDEPYQFSGFGFIFNHEKAREILKNYITTRIKELRTKDKLFSDEYLDEDQKEALAFFGLN